MNLSEGLTDQLIARSVSQLSQIQLTRDLVKQSVNQSVSTVGWSLLRRLIRHLLILWKGNWVVNLEFWSECRLSAELGI